MQVIVDEPFRRELIDAIRTREFYNRTGVHGSDLIYCLNKQACRQLKPIPDTDEETLKFSIGWATQRWLTGSFDPDTEYEVDGLKVTPDSWASTSVPWELKATYMSSNKPLEENTAWLRQMMAQCKVTGATTVKLSRFGLMGDWQWVYPNGSTKEEKAASRAASEHPTLQAWTVVFEPEEIEANWQWLLARKTQYEKILATGDLLPKVAALPPGQEYECGWCKYIEECANGRCEKVPAVTGA